jgi:predicted metalloprotease with PDZ domain
MTKKIIFIFCIVCFVSLLIPVQVSANAGVDLEYLVTISAPVFHKAHIRIKISGIESPFFILETSEFRGRYILPENFSVMDSEGNPLDYIEIPDNEPDGLAWRINTSGISEIIVEYDVLPSYASDNNSNWLHGYIDEEFAVTEGQTLFLVTDNYGEQSMHENQRVSSIQVKFDLPQDWQIAVPWHEEGGVYYPGTDNGLLVKTLSFSPLAFGEFEVSSSEILGAKFTTAVYSGWNEEDRSFIAKNAQRLFEYQKSMFGGRESGEMLIAFVPCLSDGRRIGTGEWATGHTSCLFGNSPIQDDWKLVSHGLFHRWNVWEPYGLHGSEQWMIEGIDVFYEMRAVAQLGLMETKNSGTVGQNWLWRLQGENATEVSSSEIRYELSKDRKTIFALVPLELLGYPNPMEIYSNVMLPNDSFEMTDGLDRNLRVAEIPKGQSKTMEDTNPSDNGDPSSDLEKVTVSVNEAYMKIELNYAGVISNEYRYDVYFKPVSQKQFAHQIGFSPFGHEVLYPELTPFLESSVGFYKEVVNDPTRDEGLYSSNAAHINYSKASMVVFELSKEIYEMTNGEVTINDVMYELYQDCGINHQSCSTSYFNQKINTMTGENFNPFFEKYVYGTEVIDFDWIFEDTDDDSIISGIEVLLDTDRFSDDTDGDGFTDDIELMYQGDPTKMDVLPEPTPLPSSTPTTEPTAVPTIKPAKTPILVKTNTPVSFVQSDNIGFSDMLPKNILIIGGIAGGIGLLLLIVFLVLVVFRKRE